jgi:NTE family protein
MKDHKVGGPDAAAVSGDAQTRSNILSPALLRALQRAGTSRNLDRGSRLIAHGTKASSFFIVVRGRFNVVFDGHVIAEISSGEPIGEIAFFAGGVRSADVIAARASEIVEITRSDYARIVDAVPELPNAILSALAERVRTAVPVSQTLAPRPGQVIGVFPAAGGNIDPGFLAGLTKRLAMAGARELTKGKLAAGQSVSQWLAEHENPDQKIVLTCEHPDETQDWARQVFENIDTVLLVLDPNADGAGQLSQLESRIGEVFLPSNIHLAILQRDDGDITGTAALLENRGEGLHHHIRAGHPADLDRLTRFLTGTATGVVFGGGGAFGTAHLGLIKALSEHGFEFDIIGGASVGTAMGAAYAMGLTPDEVLDRCDELFLKSRAMKRLTVPFYSIIDHNFFDRQLKHHFGDRQIEDLPLNYFAVATSLTRNDLSVLRRGDLWRAVRASSSIPAVFPPMVMDDGEVMIDGAFIDNVPVATMRGLKSGINLVLSLEQKRNWRINTAYDTLPGRSGAIKRLAFGKMARRVRFPGIFSVMTRSMIVNSERRLANANHGDDIFLPIRPLNGMGFLQWERGRDLFDLTYQRTAEALEEASKTHSGPELLREASRKVAKAG